MFHKDKLNRPNGTMKLIFSSAETGDVLDEKILKNVVVDGALYSLLRGIGGDTSANYQISNVKLGTDFTNTWSSVVGVFTTDISDPTHRKLIGIGSDLVNLIPDQASIDLMNAGKLWIKSSSGEFRKVVSIDTNTQTLFVDYRFDTDLVSDTITYEIGYNTDEPELPLTTFDDLSMDIIFDAGGGYAPFGVDFSLIEPKVSFQFTIVGSDVIDYQLPSVVSSVVFNSASLHLGNGDVFSYIRFPKNAISTLVNITVVWSIYF